MADPLDATGQSELRGPRPRVVVQRTLDNTGEREEVIVYRLGETLLTVSDETAQAILLELKRIRAGIGLLVSVDLEKLVTE